MEGSDAWALVMKLGKNTFCHGSQKFSDNLAFLHNKMVGPEIPAPRAYDAKAYAFARLQGVSELKFSNAAADNSIGASVSVRFETSSTPQTLLTTNAIKFSEYPVWEEWKKVFGPQTEGGDNALHDEWNLAPTFMRAGQTVMDPRPPCRSGNYLMEGCAKPCTFCFYVGRGNACPGDGNFTDHVTYGIGNNRDSCYADSRSCSATGTQLQLLRPEGESMEMSTESIAKTKTASTQEGNVILVWAKVSEEMLDQLKERPQPPAAFPDRKSQSQNQLAQEVMDLSVTHHSSTEMHDGVEVVVSRLENVLLNPEEVPVETGVYTHKEDSRMCPGCGSVFYKQVGEHMWALVMKLSKNEFCYNSERWTDGLELEPYRMLDPSFPKHKEYDAKSLAFHRLAGVTQIIVESSKGAIAPTIFQFASTPEKLITANTVPLGAYPDWASWNAVFGSAANTAPMFVRGGMPVLHPAPPCRTMGVEIKGCGQPCTFCFFASKGAECPAAGQGDDQATGLGNNKESCDADPEACSAATLNSGPNQVLVWAKVPADWLLDFSGAHVEHKVHSGKGGKGGNPI
jgi:hypothetical protein